MGSFWMGIFTATGNDPTLSVAPTFSDANSTLRPQWDKSFPGRRIRVKASDFGTTGRVPSPDVILLPPETSETPRHPHFDHVPHVRIDCEGAVAIEVPLLAVSQVFYRVTP